MQKPTPTPIPPPDPADVVLQYWQEQRGFLRLPSPRADVPESVRAAAAVLQARAVVAGVQLSPWVRVLMGVAQ